MLSSPESLVVGRCDIMVTMFHPADTDGAVVYPVEGSSGGALAAPVLLHEDPSSEAAEWARLELDESLASEVPRLIYIYIYIYNSEYGSKYNHAYNGCTKS